ncbi:MAG: DUF4149 domain-containing protein [Chloroflexi bacterium]|nr:DUF4149 domain-containing protein [Chloroflexota bacterium]
MLLRWLHLLAALFWVGGQLFLIAVVVPVLRSELTRQEQIRLAAGVGRRFAGYSLVALGVLVVTGIGLALEHGVSVQGLFVNPWEQVLIVKVVLVAMVIPITTLHGLVYGHRLARLGGASSAQPGLLAKQQQLVRRSRTLSNATLVLSVVIVLLAVWLAVL